MQFLVKTCFKWLLSVRWGEGIKYLIQMVVNSVPVTLLTHYVVVSRPLFWCPSHQKNVTDTQPTRRRQGMSMSPFEAWERRFSHPALLSTFSLLSSSFSSDFILRRSPGSLCVGIWNEEKELPSDGLFSASIKHRQMKGNAQTNAIRCKAVRWHVWQEMKLK